MKFLSLAVAFASVGLASAATFIVQVGANNGLTYDPPSVNASVGDTVAFQFVAKNHSVTQSTFAAPCTKSGVDSGFFPVQANASVIPQWSFTLNNASAPLWFFCAQTGHCGQGMVFAVNPTAAKSFEAFQTAANATRNATTTTSAGQGSGQTGGSPSPSASAVTGTSTKTSDGVSSRLSFSSAAGLLTALGLVAGVAL